MQASARPPTPLPPQLASRGAAILALLIGLGLTGLAVWKTSQAIRSEALSQFTGHADRLVEQVADRIGQAEYGLRGARAMAAAMGGISAESFRKYVAARDLEHEFPGIRGFGFIERVRRADLAEFVARQRVEQSPAFSVRTSGDAPELLVIKFIEPLKRNGAVWGVDTAPDPVRREGAERAIASGETSLTAPIVLMRGTVYGWLLFVPVYRGEPQPTTAAERQQRLLGLLYAAIGATEVLGPLKGFANGLVAFQLFDGPAGASPVLFDSRATAAAAPGAPNATAGAPLLEQLRNMVIGGRTFTLRVVSTPKLEEGLQARAPALVGVAGVALSLLLALAILRLMQRRAQAEAQALEVSADLQRVSGGLAERERLIRLIEDSIPARLSYWDRDLRCRLANRAVTAAFGLPPGGLIGRRLDEVLPPERVPSALECARAALRGEAQQIESSVLPGRTAMVHYMPDMVGDRAEGFFIFALDITALKEAQEAAQRASLAKTQFLSNMSHEIRTPMNAVIGMLALLRRTALDARQSDYAVKAEAAARSLLSLLNDVLDFSKIEAGKMALDPRPFSFRLLLDDLAVILSASLSGKPIALRFELDPAVPPWLLGDDMRLRQILINLGGNAIKFTHSGEVRVEVALVRAGAAEAEVEVSVADTGIGIALADQQRIFMDFSQGATSTTREFGGTGLGLSICSRLAALMGSTLCVDSTPGRGSRFHFRLQLPVAAAPAQPQAADADAASAAMASAPLRGRRLLVAEDNAINQQVARELLEGAGAEVVIAANGREAVLAVAGRGPFDAVLMDVQMPVLDGYQATRDIRQRLGLADLPIIAMTANAMDSDREQCRAAGMDDHVGKPVDPQLLVATLLRHLGVLDEPAAALPPPPPAPVAPAETVDQAGAIAALGGDAALYRRLVPLFRKELADALEQLPELPQRTPRKDATRLLHSLKSTAATMGAHRLSRAAAAAERASEDAAASLDDALLAPLRAALEQTLAAFGGDDVLR